MYWETYIGIFIISLILRPFLLIKAIGYSIMSKFFNKYGTHRKEDGNNNIIFVGGLGTYGSREAFGYEYWRIIDKSLPWVPKVGPFSSIDDRAHELFYDLVETSKIRYNKSHSHIHDCEVHKQDHMNEDKNKFKHIYLKEEKGNSDPNYKPEEDYVLIGHSSGGLTIYRFLYLLHKQHAYLVNSKDFPTFTKDGFPGDIKDYSQITEPIFTKDNGEAFSITPRRFKKLITVSTPRSGVEYYENLGMDKDTEMLRKDTFTYTLAKNVSMLYHKFPSIRKYYDFHFPQFKGRNDITNSKDIILRDFIPENSRKHTNKGLSVISLYDLRDIRVISSDSVKVQKSTRDGKRETFTYPNPFASIIIHALSYFQGEYRKNIGENDGVLTVESQKYGRECDRCKNCIHPKNKEIIRMCTHCKMVYTNYDHVEITGIFRYISTVDDLYSKLLNEEFDRVIER